MSTASGYRRAILMGDPTYFSVRGGANPHTRTRWGLRRSVDRGLAIRQWCRLRDVLRDLGLRILVVPPAKQQPGTVYPANAGFQTDLDAEKPLSDKCFHLANLLPSRAGEKPLYQEVLGEAGFRIADVDERYRFEGEADFFPVGDHYLLTFGCIEKQRFVLTADWPPWKRVYGFRTDQRVEPLLTSIVEPSPVLHVELLLEAHYHGDTALCAFGPRRQHLLAFSRGIVPHHWDRVRSACSEQPIDLEEDDAGRYAANSFSFSQGSDSVLVMPEGVSDNLMDEIRERGVEPVTVDVSEFLKKGGGSVKCMIGDLGPVAGDVELGQFEFTGG